MSSTGNVPVGTGLTRVLNELGMSGSPTTILPEGIDIFHSFTIFDFFGIDIL